MAFYRVAEFAKLAGVTVRTLQYYDRIDLLKPSHTTEGGHRLYERRDLLRLQHILTLKWMGFKLEQIKPLLDGTDLHTALRMQKAAIDHQIARLLAASEALERALTADEIDGLEAVIRAVTPSDEWVKAYYSDEAWAGISTRRMQYSEADFARFAADWRELIDQFAELRHLPPESRPVQALAATMAGYIDLFTAGDADTEAGLRDLRHDQSNLPPEYRIDDELHQFMQAAMTIYRRNEHDG